MVGQSIGSRFVLGELVGRGAMGRVHRATARDDGHEVAVKLLRDDLADQPDVVSRFVQERRLLRTVHHPNVVQVHDLIVDGDVLAIVMDLVSDGDLTRLGPSPLEPQRAATVLAEVADGLAAVHAAGVVHCDLKPANVLVHLREDGSAQPKLTDFGVSRLLSGTVTATQTVFGSPGYLAPEVASGKRPTPAADVYALGVMLYDFLTGRHPFVAEHPIALLRAHAMDPVPVPTGLPADLLDLLMSTLEKDPAGRPSAAAVAVRLRAVAPELAGAGPFAVPPADGEPLSETNAVDAPTMVGAPPVNAISPVHGVSAWSAAAAAAAGGPETTPVPVVAHAAAPTAVVPSGAVTRGDVAPGGDVARGGVAARGGAGLDGVVARDGVAPDGAVAPDGVVAPGGLVARGGVAAGGAVAPGGVAPGGAVARDGVARSGVAPGGVAPGGGVARGGVAGGGVAGGVAGRVGTGASALAGGPGQRNGAGASAVAGLAAGLAGGAADVDGAGGDGQGPAPMTPSRPLELGGRLAEFPANGPGRPGGPRGPKEPGGESWLRRVPQHYLVGAVTAVLLVAVVLAVTLYPRQPQAKAQASGGGDLAVTDQVTPSAAASTQAPAAAVPTPSVLSTELAQRIGNSPVVPRVPSSRRPVNEQTTTSSTDETTTPGAVLPAAPVVADQSLPDGVAGESYSASLTARGKATPFTWSRTGGTLPDGLTLSRGGVVSGVPTGGDSTSFTVKVKDANGRSDTAVVTILVTQKAKAGDLDGDGDVDCTDYGILQAALGSSDGAADLNGDGTVDAADGALLLAALDAGGDCSA